MPGASPCGRGSSTKPPRSRERISLMTDEVCERPASLRVRMRRSNTAGRSVSGSDLPDSLPISYASP
jgi:hypothetical protein